MKLIKTVLLISAFAVVTTTANAQTCKGNITATTPDDRFIDNGNGTVTDRQTNLIWMRCALGQIWDGSTCTGSAQQYTWQAALQAAESYIFAGSSTWRVPNVKQLASIMELACHDPAINLNIFPQTPAGWYRTASPTIAYTISDDPWHVNRNNHSWNVNFGDVHYESTKLLNHFVRLVRPGSPLGWGEE